MKKLVSSWGHVIQERTLYVFIAFAMCIIYIDLGFVLPYTKGESASRIQNILFGFSQFSFLATNVPLAITLFLFICITFLIHKLGLLAKFPLTHNGYFPLAIRIALSLLAVGVFFVLRNNFINPDGYAFAQKFLQDVPLRGAHVTHDEMWELYLHSRFWFYTNQYLGWSVELSYQVLSCLAGGAFIFVLLTYCPRIFPNSPLLAFLVCISGGYLQLFFGDIENYTLTATWITGYFLVSVLFLEKKISIVLPCVILAIAITFHLLAGFLIPSLIFLCLMSWKRGERHLVHYALVGFCLIIGVTFIFFHLNGLPLNDLWYNSHAFGHGGNIISMLSKPSLRYYFDIANLAFLLVPAWVFIFPLLIYRRIALDAMNIHLLIATCGMAILVLGWRAQLGVYNDWNLFASAALPVSFLVWRNVLRIQNLQLKYSPVRILGWVFLLHSGIWIVANHFK